MQIQKDYRTTVFYSDYLLCATAFLIFWSKEIAFGGVGCLRLPSEALLMLLSMLSLFVIAGQGNWRSDLGLAFTARSFVLEQSFWIGIYIVWLLISSIFASIPFVAWKAVASTLWCIIPAYYLLSKILKENTTTEFGKYIVFCALIGLGTMSIYAWIHSLILSPLPIDKIFRIPQPFLNDHTQWGALCAMLLFPAIYLSIYGQGKGVRILSLFGTLALLLGLWVSHSRAAMATVILAVCIWACVVIWQKYLKKYGLKAFLIFAFILSCALSAGIAYIYKTDNVTSKSENWKDNMLSLVDYKQDPSSMERINRWKCALKITSDNPIVGSGLGTYQFVYGPYQQKEDITSESTINGDRGNAHSEYLSAFSETGIVGGIIFLIMVVVGFLNGILAYIKTSEANISRKAWILSLILGLSSYFVHAIFNNFLNTDSACFIVFAFWAILSFEYKRTSTVEELVVNKI